MRNWWIEDDKSTESQEQRTMKIIRQAAEDVVSWLEFTIDLPSDHSSGRVPMLDLEVWVDHQEEMEGKKPRADILKWSFYEKPSVSSRVLRATTGYSWQSKIVCMNMEVFPPTSENLEAGASR